MRLGPDEMMFQFCEALAPEDVAVRVTGFPTVVV
jgi:hypothetical protein